MSADARPLAPPFHLPMMIRGERIEPSDTDSVHDFGGAMICAPDPIRHMPRLGLRNRSALDDLHALSIDAIVDFLAGLQDRLEPSRNVHLNWAMRMSLAASGLAPSIVEAEFRKLSKLFDRAHIEAVADGMGRPFLEGWCALARRNGDPMITRVRAVGARSLHIIAGNTPALAALTLVRNAVARSDAIIKIPSNDPGTAVALAQTMIDYAPDHPITRHMSVAYWRGGRSEIENRLLGPHYLDKIFVWGGQQAVDGIRQRAALGVDVISFDPKISISVIDLAELEAPGALHDAADRLARDAASLNQTACFNARIVYLIGKGDAPSHDMSRRLAEATIAAVASLPEAVSGAVLNLDPVLADDIQALRLTGVGGQVLGRLGECCIVISDDAAPVDFAGALSGKAVNFVIVPSIDAILPMLSHYTQTIGLYPMALHTRLAERLALAGGQRITALGCAAAAMHPGAPQDGQDVLRRHCRWVSDSVPASAEDAHGAQMPEWAIPTLEKCDAL